MKKSKQLFITACLLILSVGAFAQSRINAVNHTPNPAFSGNSINALLNVNLWNSCEYYNGAQVVPMGNTLNVYLDFNTSPGWCNFIIWQTDINVPLGVLSAGSYTVNFYDWDSNTFIRSYNLVVNSAGNGGWNSCSAPVLLNCGSTYFGNNNNGRYSWTTYTNLTGNTVFTNMTGPETIHEFTLGTTSHVTITLSGNWNDLDLMLSNNCSNFGILAWSGNSGSSGEQIVMNNLAPGTYRVIVDGWQGAVSNYNLSLSCISSGCTPPSLGQLAVSNIGQNNALIACTAPGITLYQFRYKPSNSSSWTTLNQSSSNSVWLNNLSACTNYDFQCRVYCNGGWSGYSVTRSFQTSGCYNPCNNAIPLGCNQGFYGSTFGLPNNWSSYGCSNWYESGNEQVFSLVTNSWGNISAALSNMNFDGDVFILNACSNNACIAYGDNSAIAFNQPPGIYYIVVDGYNGQFGSFYLTVNANCNTNPPGGVSADDPCAATTIFPNWSCAPTNMSNVGATTTYSPAPDYNCDNQGSSADVWVRLQIPATGQVRITSFAGSLTDGVVSIYSGSSCNALTYVGCRDDNADGTTMPALTVTGPSGAWIWLRYWGYAGQVGSFSVCATILTNLTAENPADFVLAEEGADDRDDTPETVVATVPELKLFPVPAADHINVEFSTDSDQNTVFILDLNGKVVRQFDQLAPTEPSKATHLLDISNLPNGMYFIRIKAGEQTLSSRFTKVQ